MKAKHIHTTFTIVTAISVGTPLLSCQKKKSSTETTEETDSVPVSGGGGTPAKSSTSKSSKATSVDNAVVTEATKLLALNGSLSIIPAKSSTTSLHLAGTEYESDPSDLYVQDDSFEALQQASGIYCFVNRLGYIDMVNKGKYLAQVNEDECFGSKGSGSGSSDSQQGAVQYTSVIVESKREEGKPLQVDFWLGGGGGSQDSSETDTEEDPYSLQGKLVVAGGATAKNPVGVFRLNWAERGGGGGGLESFGDENGDIIVRMVNISENQYEKQDIALSAVLKRDGTTEEINGGLMNTKLNRSWQGQSQDSAYKVAFNDDRMLRKSVAGEEKCFDRNEFYTLAWNYNLYTKSDGKRVTINSGYPLEFKNEKGKIIKAHIGYYGLWAENNESIPAGATVSRITDWNTHAKQDYTVIKSNGKLVKNTLIELKLAEIVGIDLNSWNPTTSKQVRVTYNGTKFEVTAEYQQDGSSGSWKDVTASDFTLAGGQNFFWSEGLGSVVILVENNAVSKITITTTEDVTATAGNLSLACVVECPVASITSAMIAGTSNASPFSPDRDWSNPPTFANKVTYDYVQSEMAIKRGGTKVDFASGATLSGSQRYRGGIRSGQLIPAADATSLSAFYTASVFYTWEMGQDSWNMFTGIKDSAGAVVKFDAPLQFTYTHKQANDADGRGTSFYDKKFRLNYGGPGQLWGIPSEKSTQGWYAPLFSIKSGSELGADNKYLIKIAQGEQRMKEASSCTGLVLDAVPPLPAKADLKPIDFTVAPSDDELVVEVIDGEILGGE